MARPLMVALTASLAACGGVDAESGGTSEGAPACDLEAGAVLHAASFTDANTSIYAPDQLVADADYVYFADGRAIHRLPRCGGAAEALIPGARPFNEGLALADGALYWIEGDDGVSGPRVVAAPVAGGDPLTLAEFAGYAHQLRVSGPMIAWDASVAGFPDESQLHVIGVDGSDHRVVARHRYGWSFDLDDGILYAAGYLPESDPAASDRKLFALPLDGGPPTVLVDGFGDEYPTGVVVGGEEVFYLRAWSTDMLAIERVPKVGGAPQVYDLAGAPPPASLVFAGDQLYGVEATGDVVRIVDGAPPTSLTSTPLGVTSRVFGDGGGLFVGDHTVECIEWWMDPSGEPPGATCVRETIDARLLFLGR